MSGSVGVAVIGGPVIGGMVMISPWDLPKHVASLFDTPTPELTSAWVELPIVVAVVDEEQLRRHAFTMA